MKQKVHIIDTTLRDGSHALRHQVSRKMVRDIASGLDAANTEIIEISHGDGLSGSSYNYGFSLEDEIALIKEAGQACKRAIVAALLIPGIGTVRNMRKAADAGIKMVRIATHVTEANIALEHIKAAKANGLRCVGFLMMVHMEKPEKILEQARIFEDAGVDYVNLADSAGNLLSDGVKARVGLLAEKLSIPVGFHAHNNLGMAIANSLTAVEYGATYLDATMRGLGAGAGNAQHEILTCLLQRQGYDIREDREKLFAVASDYVDPIIIRPQVIDNNSIMLGNEGVYSSFLLHVERISRMFSVSPYQIIVELGKRRIVGGQEDMITDIAYKLSQNKA